VVFCILVNIRQSVLTFGVTSPNSEHGSASSP
jgi:hypothetical protein